MYTVPNSQRQLYLYNILRENIMLVCPSKFRSISFLEALMGQHSFTLAETSQFHANFRGGVNNAFGAFPTEEYIEIIFYSKIEFIVSFQDNFRSQQIS